MIINKASNDATIQFYLPNSILVHQHHLASSRKAEVCNSTLDEYFPNQLSAGRPHIYTITASTVNVPFGIALDPIWYSAVGEGEDTTVGQVRCFVRVILDIESKSMKI